MSSTLLISATAARSLHKHHEVFSEKAKIAGCSTAASSFLLIGALIVITCGCLCLNLSGVNVINQVILPAVVPGVAAILLSIPFIIASVKYAREKNAIRQDIIDTIFKCLREDRQDLAEMDEEEQIAYIQKNFLDESWKKEYQSKLIADIKEEVEKHLPEKQSDPKKRNRHQQSQAEEGFLKMLDEVRTRIYETKK